MPICISEDNNVVRMIAWGHPMTRTLLMGNRKGLLIVVKGYVSNAYNTIQGNVCTLLNILFVKTALY